MCTPGPPAGRRPAVGRPGQRRLGQHRLDDRPATVAQGRPGRRDAGRRSSRREQLMGVRPELRRPPPASAGATPRCRRRAAASTARVVEVVGRLLARLARRSPASRSSARAGQRRRRAAAGTPRGTAACAIVTREVAVGQLDQQAVAELAVVAQVGQRRPRRGRRPRLAGVGQQQPGRAELVEGDVGQRDVLLQLGRAGAPLGQPLGGDQRVVAEPQRRTRRRRRSVTGAATPSGTS